MAYFEAAGLQFAPLPEAINTAGQALYQGLYHDTGGFGPAPVFGMPIYDDKMIPFVDVDGVARVRYGFRGRPIFATLVFAGTLAYCDATSKTTLDTLKALARYEVSMPGGTAFEGCTLMDVGQPAYINANSGCLLVIPCIFMQLSETN